MKSGGDENARVRVRADVDPPALQTVVDEPGANGPGAVDEPSERALGSRAPQFIKNSRSLHAGWKVGVFIAGLAVVGAGIVLLPLPGPGWVVIFLGVGVWATEFIWAQLLLRWVKRKISRVARNAMDPADRRRNIVVLTGVLIVIGAAIYLSVWEFDLVML